PGRSARHAGASACAPVRACREAHRLAHRPQPRSPGVGQVTAERPVVVAIDGGGSKTDAVALELDGTLVARATGPGSSPHFEGLDDSVSTIDALVQKVAGGRPVAHAAIYLSGLDL